MAKEYVPIFFEWLDVTQDLTAEEKGNLIDAVVSYASGREYEHLLDGAPCRIAFRFLKGQVDRNAAISDVRRQARQGKTQQTITSDNKPQQATTNLPKEKEKEKEKDKNKDKDKDKEAAERFETFWKVYPRHVNRKGAEKAFAKLNPDDALLQTMISAVERQTQTAQWRENGGQFIPHPATWLNGRRWEDELPAGNGGNVRAVVAQDYEQRDYDEEPEDPAAMIRRLNAEMQIGAV